jgi:hypothetical protein
MVLISIDLQEAFAIISIKSFSWPKDPADLFFEIPDFNISPIGAKLRQL